jgi:anti-anti-sigma regulatory factor
MKTLNTVIFDLKSLTYISSMGVSAVLKVKKEIEQKGARLLMANLQPQIKKVFEIIKALPAENIVGSIQELDSYLDSIQRKEIKKNKEM